MALGASSFRRLAAGPAVKRSVRDVQPAKALTEGHDGHLIRNIKQDAQHRRAGKQVKAVVYMAVYEDGDVMTHATDNVQQCTGDIFAGNAKECLRTSALQAKPNHGVHERETVPLAVLRDSTAARTCRNDYLINTRMTMLDDDSCYASRPVSARTLASTSGWPSDVDSPAPSRGLSTADTRLGSIPLLESSAKIRSMLISESSKVEDFLTRALRTMQQLAVKRIAKAWIKGICPRKQAVFPYHKKKRENEGIHEPANKPGWWPDEKLCSFVEPDHIKRDERIHLCLHLLRLRPTPAQLKQWNKDCAEPHQTHVTKGWTEFLKELAPPAVVFDESREPSDKTEERQKLLAQAYDLAYREEQYVNGEIDDTDRFCWDNDLLSRNIVKRKNRSFDVSLDESDADSLADSAPPAKKSKKTSVTTIPAGSPSVILPRKVGLDERMHDCKPSALVEPNTQISQPQLETLPVSTAYTGPVMSSPYIGYGHYNNNNNNNNIDYYGQSAHSQSQLFALPGATAINANFGYSVPPNSPFTHGDPCQQPWHTADAVTNYQYHPEAAPPSYPLSEPRHSSAFQAPARVERGFTGHGSGVGGGAHT